MADGGGGHWVGPPDFSHRKKMVPLSGGFFLLDVPDPCAPGNLLPVVPLFLAITRIDQNSTGFNNHNIHPFSQL